MPFPIARSIALIITSASTPSSKKLKSSNVLLGPITPNVCSTYLVTSLVVLLIELLLIDVSLIDELFVPIFFPFPSEIFPLPSDLFPIPSDLFPNT